MLNKIIIVVLALDLIFLPLVIFGVPRISRKLREPSAPEMPHLNYETVQCLQKIKDARRPAGMDFLIWSREMEGQWHTR